MANSIITVLGDGVTTQYALNFTLGILKREYITCRVGDEVDGLGDPAYRPLEWVTDGLVNIQGAVPGDDVPIVFERTIPKNILLHNYSDGVPITEANLDESNLQHIMSIHEFLDGRLENGFVQKLNMNNFKIINVAPGVDDTDAANMSQINAVIGDATDQADLAQDWAVKTNGLAESIDNSSKAYAVGGTGVTNTAGKGAAKEWATKTGSTVDTAEYGAKEYAVGDLTATGGSAKAWAVAASSPNGTSDLSAKSYTALTAADRVQTGADRVAVAADRVTTETARDQAVAASNGMKYRSVRAATTGNITLSGTQTIDTVAVIAGDRVLVRAQTAPAENGLYVVAAGAWTRASDADTWNELVSSLVVVEEGTSFVDYTFLCTSNQGGTLGVTAVTYILWQAFIATGQVTNAMLAGGIDLTSKVTGILPIANGGTGLGTLTANSVILGNDTSNPTFVAPGTTGNVLTSNGTTWQSVAQTSGLVRVAPVATTSGTAIDLATGIAAGAWRITINFSGVSPGGTSAPLIQIGDSGGYEITGYLGSSSQLAGGVTTGNYTTGFGIHSSTGTNSFHGALVLTLLNASTNLWVIEGNLGNATASSYVVGGSKALSAVLDRVRITTVGGTDNFDGGSMSVIYEYQ